MAIPVVTLLLAVGGITGGISGVLLLLSAGIR
jgi:hypothetical protein